MVIAFLLCVLFLYKTLRALIHIFSKKGEKFIQRLRKRKSSSQKEKVTGIRSEPITSQNNDDSVRRRKAVRSPERRGEDSVKIPRQNDSSSRDSKKKSTNTSKYSVLSLDWKNYHDPDEREE